MKKFNILVFASLIILSTFLLFQLISANQAIEEYREKEIGLFSITIWDYTTDLTFLTETLLDYSDDYTKEEKDLYKKLLSSYGLRLDRHQYNLNSLRHLNPTSERIYEDYIYYINDLLLNEIKNLSESEVHSIGGIIGKYRNELYAKIHGLDYNKVISDDTEMRKLLDIISRMNNDIEKVVNVE